MEARRGRRHAYERVDPRTTALVVVDVIPFFADVDPGWTAAIDGTNALAARVRSGGGTVAWVVPAVAPPTARDVEFHGAATAAAYAASGGPGTPGQRLWPALVTADDDLVVEKHAASAFFPGRCPLPELLAAREIDTVLIVGAVTSVCCESAARDASTLGYRVIVIPDLTSGGTAAARTATFTVIYRSFGDVRPAREVFDLLDRGPGAPQAEFSDGAPRPGGAPRRSRRRS